MCTSEVQIRAAVVRTIASSGPGSGIGFSTTSVAPTVLITKDFIVSGIEYCPLRARETPIMQEAACDPGLIMQHDRRAHAGDLRGAAVRLDA
ncbi:hypothetical protein GCM10017691_30080 [Pseudonocardia petroleophila]